MARGLHVLEYTPGAVKKAITGADGATKRQVAERIVTWFPYLERYLRTDRRTQEGYWQNMFDAVALGLTGIGDIEAGRAKCICSRIPPLG